MRRSILTPLIAVLALALLALGATACGGRSGDELSLVAYSTPKEAYAEIVPAWNKTSQGKGIAVKSSFKASGDQARSVLNGLTADVVALSLEPDVTKLVDGGKVAPNWRDNKYRGMVTDSVVVFAVRKGNPKNIKTWDDLIKPGIEVITPNPSTSGGARWNIMAAYGAQIKQGKTKQQADDYLKQLFEHVAVQDKSARESLTTFTQGKGDVLLAYENEAITAKKKDQEVDYLIPDQTILIENPAAVTTVAGNPAKAKEFLNYLWTPEAQKIYAANGYRPVDKAVLDTKQFPTPPGLFTIDDIGGWKSVSKEFFDPDNGIVTKIQEENDVATS